MKRSFDRVSRLYWLLENMVFGDALQQTRTFCLPFAAGCSNGLLIGDGDGRFAKALLDDNRQIRVTSIDASAGMLRRAGRRLADHRERATLLHADVRSYSHGDSRYDFIALHFVLDCFPQRQVDALLSNLTASLKPGGLMVVSDFRINSKRQAALIRLLYGAFGLLTDIQARNLPIIRKAADLRCVTSTSLHSRLLFSEVWKKPDREPTNRFFGGTVVRRRQRAAD